MSLIFTSWWIVYNARSWFFRRCFFAFCFHFSLCGAGKVTWFSLEKLALSNSIAWSKIKPLQAGSVENLLFDNSDLLSKSTKFSSDSSSLWSRWLKPGSGELKLEVRKALICEMVVVGCCFGSLIFYCSLCLHRCCACCVLPRACCALSCACC